MTSLIMVTQGLLTLAFVLVLVFTPEISLFGGERGIGIVVVLIGAGILAAAVAAYRETLGTFKVKPTPEPSERGGLITRGIYGWIRHPFYAATPLILTGTALITRRPWGLAMIPPVVGFLYLKSSFEEKLLMAKFPEYAVYKAKTGRFLPRLKK